VFAGFFKNNVQENIPHPPSCTYSFSESSFSFIFYTATFPLFLYLPVRLLAGYEVGLENKNHIFVFHFFIHNSAAYICKLQTVELQCIEFKPFAKAGIEPMI
jgi:hypothetical protein